MAIEVARAAVERDDVKCLREALGLKKDSPLKDKAARPAAIEVDVCGMFGPLNYV